MNKDHLIELLKKNAKNFALIGSRATCNPPPVGTDTDYLVLFDDVGMHWFLSYLAGSHLRLDKPGEHYDVNESDFNSWRGQGNINIITTKSNEFYDRFMMATEIAKRLNLLERRDRVMLFQAILYGKLTEYDTAKNKNPLD